MFFSAISKSGADIFGCLDFEMRKWAFSNALRNGLSGMYINHTVVNENLHEVEASHGGSVD